MLNDSHRKGRNSMPSEKRQTLRLEIPTLQILCALLWSTSPNQTHTTNTTILAAQGHTLLELLICFFLQTVLPDVFQNEDLPATAQWSSCTPCMSKNITWCKTAQNKPYYRKKKWNSIVWGQEIINKISQEEKGQKRSSSSLCLWFICLRMSDSSTAVTLCLQSNWTLFLIGQGEKAANDRNLSRGWDSHLSEDSE